MELYEDEEHGMVVVDGQRMYGFIDDEPCPQCQQFRIYHEDFDACFCAACNLWLETACDGPSCDYCRNRPVQPLV